MRPVFSLALAQLLALGLAASAYAAPTSKSFRDWIAGCDNLKSCTAISLPGEGAEPVVFLKLGRPAGPEGAATVEVKVRGGEALKAPLAFELAIDGAPFPAAGKRWATTSVDGETAEMTLSAAETEALVAAARKATTLAVRLAGKSHDVSLAGSVAAMLWIDEQQGRLNTVSALVRKGSATAVPPAPALPTIAAKGSALAEVTPRDTKALTDALRRQVKRVDPDSCEDRPDDLTDADGVWPLDQTTRLVGLLCSRGAYNLSTAFWIVPDGDVAKARKAVFPQRDGKRDNVLVNAEYDAATGQVAFDDKGRGIGDCGASGNYAWTGRAFVLTALQVMSECRGITAEDWIMLFRSEVTVAR